MGSRVVSAARGATSAVIALLAVLACWVAWDDPGAGLPGGVVVLAPLALMFWWSGHLLLDALLTFAARDDRARMSVGDVVGCLRLSRLGIVLQPVAISVTCLAACAGVYVLATAQTGAGAGLIAAIVVGGALLRVMFGTALARAITPALPESLRREIAGVLRGSG